jgi:hypothetical protein
MVSDDLSPDNLEVSDDEVAVTHDKSAIVINGNYFLLGRVAQWLREVEAAETTHAASRGAAVVSTERDSCNKGVQDVSSMTSAAASATATAVTPATDAVSKNTSVSGDVADGEKKANILNGPEKDGGQEHLIARDNKLIGASRQQESNTTEALPQHSLEAQASGLEQGVGAGGGGEVLLPARMCVADSEGTAEAVKNDDALLLVDTELLTGLEAAIEPTTQANNKNDTTETGMQSKQMN